MIKTLEGLISVKFLNRNDKVFQYFIIDNKRVAQKYLTDKRFIVYDKFQEKIRSLALSNDSNFSFIERRDEDEKITLEFHINDISKFEKPQNYYFVIAGFVPPCAGCEFCTHRKDIKDTFFYCDFKQKTLTSKMKTCQYFRQIDNLFST